MTKREDTRDARNQDIENTRRLLHLLIRALVDHPGEVTVQAICGSQAVMYEIRVDPISAISGLLRTKLLANSRFTSSLLPAAGASPASVVTAGARAISLSISALVTTCECSDRVDPDNVRRIIGRKGRTADACREILMNLAAKARSRFLLEILELE